MFTTILSFNLGVARKGEGDIKFNSAAENLTKITEKAWGKASCWHVQPPSHIYRVWGVAQSSVQNRSVTSLQTPSLTVTLRSQHTDLHQLLLVWAPSVAPACSRCAPIYKCRTDLTAGSNARTGMDGLGEVWVQDVWETVQLLFSELWLLRAVHQLQLL